MRNLLLCHRRALHALTLAALRHNALCLGHPHKRNDQGNEADKVREERVVPPDFGEITRNRRIYQVEQELNRDTQAQKTRALLAFEQSDDSRVSHGEHHTQADAYNDARNDDERIVGDIRHQERESTTERHHQNTEDGQRLVSDAVQNRPRKHTHGH